MPVRVSCRVRRAIVEPGFVAFLLVLRICSTFRGADVTGAGAVFCAAAVIIVW